ncbi:universal stress protein [Streptomyces sp. NPDC051218]|uniref:universal stress protein n=1 Tax=Streptomyces sp. NPDC051218 TaxID=3365645 RepID=UPI0037B8C350
MSDDAPVDPAPAGPAPDRDAPVVVAVDGSAGSDHALEWALTAARLRNARLRIVHVRQYAMPLADGPHMPTIDHRPDADPVVERVRGALERRADLPPLTVEIVEGAPGRDIAPLGDEAQLLVLGSRGRGGFASLLLGSNGLACAREAACPVVVVRPDEELTAGAEPCVVLGLDPLSPHDDTIGFAFVEAALRGAVLRVVCAYPGPVLVYTSTGDFVTSAEADAATAARYTELAGEQLAPFQERNPQVSVEKEVLPGDAAGLLVDASREAELVVVGRHQSRMPLGRLMGSVTNAVLLHAKGAVAVVPPEHR